jgi:hypothetical protein
MSAGETMKWRLSVQPVLFVVMAASAHGQEQTPDVTNQFGVRLFLHHNIKNSLAGFGYLEYATNPESDYRRYRLGWPGRVQGSRARRPADITGQAA